MNILNQVVVVTTAISNIVWPVFLPLLVIASLYITWHTFTKTKKQVRSESKLSFKEMIGPASISLGAKIGTGAVIGVLGSLNKLAGSGQGFIEGVVLWGLLGACVLIPLTYSETLTARLLDQSPVQYIENNISKKASSIYCIALVILYIFGFGGFQFNGMDTVMTISAQKTLGIQLTEIQRFLFVVIPIIVVASGIIISKKHELFINAMSGMIGLAVLSYFGFFFMFLGKTINYLPEFLSRAFIGFSNPVAMGVGVPIGLILGLQRIIQTSEAGLGTSPLASEEGKSMGAHNAAMSQVIPTAITVVVSLLITSYITSYGISQNVIQLPGSGIDRLYGFFNTAELVTGQFGLVIISMFAVLSGVTTLLGSFFFLTQLFKDTNENLRILVYIVLITVAGTLAVFGFDIIFDVVDILLFAVSGLNVWALTVFVWKMTRKGGESVLKKAS